MKIDIFELERIQSLYENLVKYNLTESGLHPYTLQELLTEDEIKNLLDVRLGYGQTDGSIALRDAISRLYNRADRTNVLATNGSAEANFIGMWSLLEPGDEIVLMLPNYMQIHGLARSFGANVKPFHLKEHLLWGPDIDELKNNINANTKLIAICNPNNPTGAVLSKQDMETIVELAREVNAWVYADEIYRGAELDGVERPSFYGNFDYDKVIVTGGLSKAYGLPGLRMGWLAGPAEFIENAWAYHDYTSISTGILSQEIATKALTPEMRPKLLGRSRRMLNENLGELQKWIDSHSDLFRFVPPKAGGMVFLHYNMDINSRELATRLRKEKSVFVMDGDCFGMDHYIRIGIGSEKDYLLAGLDLVDELLNEIKV